MPVIQQIFAYNTGSTISGTSQVGDIAIIENEANYYPGLGGLQWWGGPDESQGYVIAAPVSGNTQQTPVFGGNLILSPTYKGTDILLVNSQSALQQFGYQQSVLGQTLINNVDKVMFSVQPNVCTNPGNPFFQSIGVGTTSMNYQGTPIPFGAYPGNDNQSVGFSMDGNFYNSGSIVQSALPTWTINDIIDVAVDLYSSVIWIRVNNGNWNNNPFANPAIGVGGLSLYGLTSFYPVLSPGNDAGQMTILSSPYFLIPEGYQFLGTNVNASLKFYGTKNMPNPFNESTFVELVNTQFNQSFTTGNDASTWLTTNGYWNSYPSPVLYLDAGNTASYSGTGTAWTDLVGGKVFTLNNSPTWVGNLGSIAFAGTNQYVSTTVNSAPGTDSATYEMWFYQTNNSPATQGLLQTRTSTTGGDGIDVSISSGQIQISTSGAFLLSAGSVSVNTWYHLAVVRNGTTAWTVYLNGTSIGTFNFANTTGTELSLGRKSATGFNEFFKGYITNFRYVKGVAVYTATFTPSTNSLTSIQSSNINGSPSAAITGTQTQLLLNAFTNNFLKDSSSYNLTMSNPNGATSVTNSPFTGGGYFNFNTSSSQYAASSTSLPTLTTWSVGVWHYYNGTNTAGQPAIVTEIYPPSINYMLGALDSSTYLQTGFFVPSAWYTTSGSYSLTSNNWYYIVGTYDGSTLKLYVNNTLINSVSASATPISSNAGIRLMRGWDSDAYWGGNLATVGIYDKSLTQSQISQIWDETKSRFGY